VWPCVIEAMGKVVDAELEVLEAGGEVFDAVELVAPRALGSFDVAVELGSLRREDEEAQAALSARALELGPELRPAIDLDPLDAEGARSRAERPRLTSISTQTGRRQSARPLWCWDAGSRRRGRGHGTRCRYRQQGA
jgi:hypothetical protein